jgi:large subunit ribosomal protein L35
VPKLKTRRGAAKRFKVTGSGRVRRAQASRSHNFTGKSRKRKRQLRKETDVSPADTPRIRREIPYL